MSKEELAAVLDNISEYEHDKEDVQRFESEFLPQLAEALGFSKDELFFNVSDGKGKVADAVISESRDSKPYLLLESKLFLSKNSMRRSTLRQVGALLNGFNAEKGLFITSEEIKVLGDKGLSKKKYTLDELSEKEICEIYNAVSKDYFEGRDKIKSYHIKNKLADEWTESDLKEQLRTVVEAETNQEKKNSLEKFANLCFNGSSFEVAEMNKSTLDTEIDLVIESLRESEYNFSERFGRYAIVECKNWSDSVGAEQINKFSSIMDNFKVDLGLFFAKNGITGEDISRGALNTVATEFNSKEKFIVVISKEDMEKLANGQSIDRLIHQKVYEIKFNS